MLTGKPSYITYDEIGFDKKAELTETYNYEICKKEEVFDSLKTYY